MGHSAHPPRDQQQMPSFKAKKAQPPRKAPPPALPMAMLLFLLLLHTPTTASATFSWPRARIPFEDDPRLVADPDFAVALNNARMDLQVRTCIRLVPRRSEKDYAYFTDLGPSIECWNMFEPFPPKGRILVNAGPSCLEPMRRPHRPKRVFSDCDVEYVNHLYNCPRRRKPSPICPAGRLIMARPSELNGGTTAPAMDGEEALAAMENTQPPIGTTAATTMGAEDTTEGEEETAVGAEESAEATEGTTTEGPGEESSSGGTEQEQGESTTEATTEVWLSSTPEEEPSLVVEVVERQNGGTTAGPPEEEQTSAQGTETAPSLATTVAFTEAAERETARTETTREEWTATTTQMPPTVAKTTAERTTATTAAATIATAETEVHSTTTEAMLPSPSPIVPTTAPASWTTMIVPFAPETAALWSGPTGEGPVPSTTTQVPDSTARAETDGPPRPYPFMMTLITTTTTTTIAPPPPDWVRSVEESFRARQGDGGERLELHERTTTGAGRPLGPPEPVSIEGQPPQGSGGDSASGEEPGGQPLVVGLIQVPSGTGISIREKTKVTRVVEKTKYIGPCGSACNYGGDLVRLFRSANNQPAVMDHFYTTERLEQHLMASQGFVMEPSMGFLGRNQIDPNCSCIRPLYRLYSGFAKDHFLTTLDQEKSIAETLLGYAFERVLGYCTKEPGCGAYLPLYRFYSPINRDHFYTSDQQEMHYYKTHTELNYGFERIECYVWQHSKPNKECPALRRVDEDGATAEQSSAGRKEDAASREFGRAKT